jgi:hypothetical protein
MVMAMYLPGNLTRVRYLAPCFPLFAIFLAAWLFSAATPEKLSKVWKILTGVGAAICFLGGLPLAIWGGELHENVARGGIFLMASAVLFGFLLIRSRIPSAVLLSVFVILLLALFDIYGRGWTLPYPEEQIAQTLLAQPKCDEVVVFSKDLRVEERHKVAARLRVCTANRINFSIWEAPQIKNTPPAFVIFKQTGGKPEVALDGYQLVPAAESVNIRSFSEIYDAWRRNGLKEYLDSCTETWFVAVKD